MTACPAVVPQPVTNDAEDCSGKRDRRLTHPFFLELLANIGEAARDRDCDFTVSHVAPASLEDLVTTATTSRANGVIWRVRRVRHESSSAGRLHGACL